MFPRAFSGQYPPGSVFKLVTGSAALQEGVANRDTVIDSKGVMYVESDEYPGVRQPFNDNAAYGPQTFFQGVANSSNIYFFWLGGGYSEGNDDHLRRASASIAWHATRARSATARARAWTSAANRTAPSPTRPGSSFTRASPGSRATPTT